MVDAQEKIPVYIDTERGRTVCICHADDKGCGKRCERDVVTLDKYFEWEKTMQRNRCGK